MNGTLYVIATPIGHLRDITLRALDILKTVDCLASEDTREVTKLLREYEIRVPELLSYHAQSSQHAEDVLIQRLQSGKSVALVSDRGTPGISDPGTRLIRAAIENGITVVPIPGASAIITALQASGVDTSEFIYIGFLPHKKGRKTLLDMMASETRTVVAYESPHRLLKALEALKDCGRMMVAARELTKIHEEFVRGTCSEVFENFSQRKDILGEFVLIIHGDPAPSHT